ncbi:MAG: sugar phosphate nucleotidyltransferase [Geminicoccaceae bacterium]
MKVAILAGGLGSRLSEETRSKSKAMVRIGDEPVLWHVIDSYAQSGFRDVVVALGYRADSVQDYFAGKDMTPIRVDEQGAHIWQDDGLRVTLVDTGLETQNGGRIKRLRPFLDEQRFMLTWCDGLSDIDFHALIDFHDRHGKLATLTAVHPPARFGRLALDGERIVDFHEKSIDPNEWINGAFFVLEPGIFDYITDDTTHWESDPLPKLAADGELMAFKHESFWQCMDTLKDAQTLNALWRDNKAPWKKQEQRQ